VPETIQPYYTSEDVQRVLKALNGRRLKGLDASRTRTIILVLFDTGLRSSELCSLRTEDVNWDGQTRVPTTAQDAILDSICGWAPEYSNPGPTDQSPLPAN